MIFLEPSSGGSGRLWAELSEEVGEGCGVADVDVAQRGPAHHGGQAQLEQPTCKRRPPVRVIHLPTCRGVKVAEYITLLHKLTTGNLEQSSFENNFSYYDRLGLFSHGRRTDLAGLQRF